MRRASMVVNRSSVVVPRRPLALAAPVRSRRRQKKKEANEENSVAQQTMLSPEAWRTVSTKMTTQIEEAFAPAIELNEGASISKNNEGTHINWGEGKGVLIVNAIGDDQTIEVISPVSGPLKYFYDASSGNWHSVHDNHDLRGIVVRDFLRAGCIGLPQL